MNYETLESDDAATFGRPTPSSKPNETSSFPDGSSRLKQIISFASFTNWHQIGSLVKYATHGFCRKTGSGDAGSK
jgi:hypothetical protein